MKHFFLFAVIAAFNINMAHASDKCDQTFLEFDSQVEDVLRDKQASQIREVFKKIYKQVGVDLNHSDILLEVDVKKDPKEHDTFIMKLSDVHVDAGALTRDFKLSRESLTPGVDYVFAADFQEKANFDSLGDYINTSCKISVATVLNRIYYTIQNKQNGKDLGIYRLVWYDEIRKIQ